MRVISQSGKTDLPYENFVIGITSDNVIVATRDVASPPEKLFHSVIAKYSTEEKAIKAMEMLREAHSKGIYIEYPKIDENKIAKDDDLSLWNAQTFTKFYPEGYYRPCKIFQFPADNEIEV
jgi:hypothetical protein